MRNLNACAESLGRTEMELREEMAASLGRIGRKLETVILQLRNLLRQDQLESQEFRKLREEAHLYYWYLIVQREAIGLRNHDTLSETFPIPDLPKI